MFVAGYSLRFFLIKKDSSIKLKLRFWMLASKIKKSDLA